MTLRIQPHIVGAALLWLLATGLMIDGVLADSTPARMSGLFCAVAASTYTLALIIVGVTRSARDALIEAERREQEQLIEAFKALTEAMLTRLVQIVELWMEDRMNPDETRIERPRVVRDDEHHRGGI